MKKYLKETATGTVVNVIEWEEGSSYVVPEGHTLEDSGEFNPSPTSEGGGQDLVAEVAQLRAEIVTLKSNYDALSKEFISEI